MEQKVIRVGNSLGVTLPSDFVKSRKIKAGQKVYVEADADLDILQLRTGGMASFTPEFKQWLDKIASKYEDVIRELARR